MKGLIRANRTDKPLNYKISKLTTELAFPIIPFLLFLRMDLVMMFLLELFLNRFLLSRNSSYRQAFIDRFFRNIVLPAYKSISVNFTQFFNQFGATAIADIPAFFFDLPQIFRCNRIQSFCILNSSSLILYFQLFLLIFDFWSYIFQFGSCGFQRFQFLVGPMSIHWTQKVELFYAASIASSSTC